MLPYFDLGPWSVHTYTLVYTVAIIVTATYCFGRLLRLGRPTTVISRGVLLAILGGWAGAFLVRAVPTLHAFIRSGTLVWIGGNSSIGVLIGVTCTWVLYARKQGIPLAHSFDIGCLAFPLGQSIGRLGCFAAGCCYGRATGSWLGMYLPNHDGVWLVRYPTQLMSAAANLLLFFLLLIVERWGVRRVGRERGWPFDGFIFLLYLDLYFLERFSIEILRGDAMAAFGPVSWVHLYTAAGLVAATAGIAWNLAQSSSGNGVPATNRSQSITERGGRDAAHL